MLLLNMMPKKVPPLGCAMCMLLRVLLLAQAAIALQAPRCSRVVRGASEPVFASEREMPNDDAQHRRYVVSRRAAAAGLGAAALAAAPRPGAAAELGLRDTLAARDANLLRKPFIAVPPGPTAYPAWLEGTWRCDAAFAGFELPSKKISKQRVIANTDLPGFTKLSVARFGDVGRESTRYEMRFYRTPSGAVYEDYARDVASSLNAHAGDARLVESVSYDVAKNANRATVTLRPGTRNGERIELFVNGRRSEALGDDVFLSSENVRQVTLGYGTTSNPNAARVVIGEYQHYATWRRSGPDAARCNVLTAVYVEPQDPMFGDAFDLPVVVYAHNVAMSRVDGAA